MGFADGICDKLIHSRDYLQPPVKKTVLAGLDVGMLPTAMWTMAKLQMGQN